MKPGRKLQLKLSDLMQAPMGRNEVKWVKRNASDEFPTAGPVLSSFYSPAPRFIATTIARKCG